MENGGVIVINSIRLTVEGKKGFLGIGATPNKYEAEVFQRAVIEITYKWKAKISATVGKKKVAVKGNLPASYIGKEQISFKCKKCGRLFTLGKDSIVVTPLGTIQSFPFRSVSIDFSNLAKTTPEHPDLVALLDPPEPEKIARNEADVEIVLRDLRMRKYRLYECFHCKEIQTYHLL